MNIGKDLQNAYLDGYNDGFKDGQESVSEKQIPNKLIMDIVSMKYYCPRCYQLVVWEEECNYCISCGQRLNWG